MTDDDDIRKLQEAEAKRRTGITKMVADGRGGWVPGHSKAKAQPKDEGCECGAYKALGCAKFMAGHSSWCPWVEP